MASFTLLLLFILIRVFYEMGKNWDAIIIKPNIVIENDVCDLRPLKQKYNMIQFLFRRKVANIAGLFNGHYIDVKVLYLFEINEVPCVKFVGEIDVTKAFAWIRETFAYDIKHTYQHAFFDHDKQQTFFNNSIFVLTNKRMIELGIDYCHVLHSRNDYAWADRMLQELATFRMVAPAGQIKITGFARQPEMN